MKVIDIFKKRTKSEIDSQVVRIRAVNVIDEYYEFEFKGEYDLFWTKFVTFGHITHSIKPIVSTSPHSYNYLSKYTYKMCVEHNEEAYRQQIEYYKGKPNVHIIK